MRKFILAALSACALFGMSSCDKAEKLLFQPFESPLNFDITIPVVSSTTAESSMGSATLTYNLDSVILANTSNKLDASVVGSMYINEIAISITDPVDMDNNLSNFSYVKMNVSTNGSTPVVLGPFDVNAGAISQDSYTVNGSPDIRSFFNGSPVSFSLTGKAKKATTHEIHARVSATIKFDK